MNSVLTVSARNCFPGPKIGKIFCLLKEGIINCEICKVFCLFFLVYGYKINARKTRQLAVRIQINEKVLNI
jgi:hypothetical protein